MPLTTLKLSAWLQALERRMGVATTTIPPQDPSFDLGGKALASRSQRGRGASMSSLEVNEVLLVDRPSTAFFPPSPVDLLPAEDPIIARTAALEHAHDRGGDVSQERWGLMPRERGNQGAVASSKQHESFERWFDTGVNEMVMDGRGKSAGEGPQAELWPRACACLTPQLMRGCGGHGHAQAKDPEAEEVAKAACVMRGARGRRTG